MNGKLTASIREAIRLADLRDVLLACLLVVREAHHHIAHNTVAVGRCLFAYGDVAALIAEGL